VNICLGSALSTISLTIPAVLAVGLLTHRPVTLGLTHVQAVMLGATLLIAMNSYRSGETNLLHGAIHFALFAGFIVLILLYRADPGGPPATAPDHGSGRRRRVGGRIGRLVMAMARGLTASATALAMAAGEPMVPPSPMPLKPPGVRGDGVSR